jgi:hypothetical protein
MAADFFIGEHPMLAVDFQFKIKITIFKRDHDTQQNDAQHNYTQYNDTQHNDTQHNDTQHNDTQHNDTQHNDTQHKVHICDTEQK